VVFTTKPTQLRWASPIPPILRSFRWNNVCDEESRW
jgi:hypothetical protein